MVGVGQLDASEAEVGALGPLFERHVGEHVEREADVLFHGKRVEERGALEYHAHLLPQGYLLPVGHLHYAAAVVFDVAAVDVVEAYYRLEEDRLARAACAYGQVDAAAAEGGVDGVEDKVVAERFGYLLYFDHRVLCGVSGLGYNSSWVISRLSSRMTMLLTTTARVLARPTSSAPPLTWYPKNDETEAITNPNMVDLKSE